MEQIKFEPHNLEGHQAPIIYHRFPQEKVPRNIANWHDNIELLYGIRGQGDVLCGGIHHSLGPGDLVIVNSNELHLVDERRQPEYHVLIVDTGFLQSSGLPVKSLYFQPAVRDEAVGLLLDEAVREITGTAPFRTAGIRGSVLRLMVYLARCYASPLSDHREHTDSGIKHAMGYIRSNYSRHLTLDEIARQAKLSKFHFSRSFKAATGMTFTAFVNGIRCRNAKKLLELGVPVNRAATLCGFDNSSYFSRTFRQVIGCLPSEIRK